MKTNICLNCNKVIEKKRFESKKTWEKKKYCSTKCCGVSKEKKKECNCDYCGNIVITKPSAYSRKKRHFCDIKCYSLFRKEKLELTEHNAYKGIRKNGESKQVYHRNYCNRHKANIAHLKARRYAREKDAIGSHTLKEWENLKLLFDNKCAKCREAKKLTKDHIVPLSKGGTDFIENIQPMCRNCNSKKHNKNPELLNK